VTRRVTTLFVYGTLQDDARVRRIVGRRLAWRPAELRGYYRTLDPTIGYPVVRRRAGARVQGRLLLEVTARTLAALDAYEGDAYRRVRARVRLSDGTAVETRVYVPVRSPRRAGARIMRRRPGRSARAPRRSG